MGARGGGGVGNLNGYKSGTTVGRFRVTTRHAWQ